MANVNVVNQSNKDTRFNSKSAPQLPPIVKAQLPENNTNHTNLRNVVVITKNDLDRITGHLDRRKKEKEAVLEEHGRKKELHEKSMALTRSWNNTIEGSRRKKLEQKKIREDKEEEERRQVDLEHAKYMAEERRKQLDQARLLQYYETDKIKSFHGALKLTEVLKERDAQVELKKVLEQITKEQEEDERAQIEQSYKQQLEEEAQLDTKKKIERAKLTDYHKAQIKHRQELSKKERDEYLKEADQLKYLTEQYYYERAELEDIQRHKQTELKQTYDKAIENRMKMKEAEKIMDEEENEEIRIYAAAKRKMAVMRREKELQIHKEKQDHRERMIAYLGSLLKQQEADEDSRIAKALEQKELKIMMEERDKYEKNRKMNDSIAKHRDETIKMKQLQKIKQEKENEQHMKNAMEADHLYQVYEDEKSKQKHQSLNNVAKTNLKKAKDRREIEKNLRQNEKNFVHDEMKLLEIEDKQFEDYASRVIDYMDKHGRNTYPLKKNLNEHLRTVNKIEPTGEAANIKKHQNDVPTNKNLGFNYQ